MDGETDLAASRPPPKRVRDLDRRVAAIAARQHGVIALPQLVDLGLSPRAVRDRAAAGRLHRMHLGVYAVGHPRLSRKGRLMAAVLAGGTSGVLSHRPAGAEWNLRAWGGRPAIIVPAWRRGPRGFDVHSSPLPEDERTVLDGIPITTYPRTIFDLASLLPDHQLGQAIEQAEVMRLSDALSIPAILERHAGERGAGALRRVLGSSNLGMGIARSELEERFIAFVFDLGLPRPELNATVRLEGRNFELDCLWRGSRVVVELIGLTFHGTRPAINRDTARNRKLLLACYRVIEVTWAQLHDPKARGELARDLRILLT